MPYEVIDGTGFDEPPHIIRVPTDPGVVSVFLKDVKEWWRRDFAVWCEERIEDVRTLRASEVTEE